MRLPAESVFVRTVVRIALLVGAVLVGTVLFVLFADPAQADRAEPDADSGGLLADLPLPASELLASEQQPNSEPPADPTPPPGPEQSPGSGPSPGSEPLPDPEPTLQPESPAESASPADSAAAAPDHPEPPTGAEPASADPEPRDGPAPAVDDPTQAVQTEPAADHPAPDELGRTPDAELAAAFHVAVEVVSGQRNAVETAADIAVAEAANAEATRAAEVVTGGPSETAVMPPEVVPDSTDVPVVPVVAEAVPGADLPAGTDGVTALVESTVSMTTATTAGVAQAVPLPVVPALAGTLGETVNQVVEQAGSAVRSVTPIGVGSTVESVAAAAPDPVAGLATSSVSPLIDPVAARAGLAMTASVDTAAREGSSGPLAAHPLSPSPVDGAPSGWPESPSGLREPGTDPHPPPSSPAGPPTGPCGTSPSTGGPGADAGQPVPATEPSVSDRAADRSRLGLVDDIVRAGQTIPISPPPG